MVKQKIKDISQELKEEDEEVYGDSDNEKLDDDVDQAFKKVVGHKPKKGKNLADEVDEAEKAQWEGSDLIDLEEDEEEE